MVKDRKKQIKRMPRASVTLPPDVYVILEQIAKEKKVSLAWVIRDAADKYIEEKQSQQDQGGAK